MGIDGDELSYMDALSSVMSDFEITKDEARYLKEWAVDLGLSQEQQKTAHEQFLKMITDAANRDGFLSETELDLIAKAAAALDVAAPSRPVQDALVNHLEVGTRVCFTGEARDADGLEIPREVLEAKAVVKGLIPVSGVTKKACELLVAADKSSMSGKTRKAREFGIPVISVEEFLKII
jgi:NAD-dependent DNA ligase